MQYYAFKLQEKENKQDLLFNFGHTGIKKKKETNENFQNLVRTAYQYHYHKISNSLFLCIFLQNEQTQMRK